MTEEAGHIYRDPDFHDGSLNGIRVTADSTLEMYCSTLDGCAYVVSLPGLQHLKADNFLKGNIIFEIELFDAPFPISRVRKAFGLLEHEHPAWFEKQVATMSQEGWTLLELSSSYGCDVVAIASGKIGVTRLSGD